MPHGFALLAIYISMGAVTLYTLNELFLWRRLILKGSRTAIAYGVFWALVLSYVGGKLFEYAQIGPTFFRYHLNDLGFVAAWGGILMNPGRRLILDHEFRWPNRKPIQMMRLGVALALILGIAWELITARNAIKLQDADMFYAGNLDYMDLFMYFIAFVVMWYLAPRMFLVIPDEPQPIVEQPTPTQVRSGTPSVAASKRVTPKGTQPQRSKSKKKRKR